MTVKKKLQAAGVEEYWIISPKERAVQIYYLEMVNMIWSIAISCRMIQKKNIIMQIQWWHWKISENLHDIGRDVWECRIIWAAWKPRELILGAFWYSQIRWSMLLYASVSESGIFSWDKKGHNNHMNIGNNIGNIMKITGAWNTFKSNHPKFPAFCQVSFTQSLKKEASLKLRSPLLRERRLRQTWK